MNDMVAKEYCLIGKGWKALVAKEHGGLCACANVLH